MTNHALQGGAFRKETTPERRHRPIQGSSFPRSRKTDNESRDDAFKKGATSPPPVRPKIEQVFTSANIHRHRTPHPANHAAHTAMMSGQHQGAGFVQEHRATTTTRAAAPAFKTSTPPHP